MSTNLIVEDSTTYFDPIMPDETTIEATMQESLVEVNEQSYNIYYVVNYAGSVLLEKSPDLDVADPYTGPTDDI